MQLARLLFRTLLGRRLPMYRGSLRIDALTAPVVIRRDAWGVPYIHAQNDEDAWYALGFCQGQDRAFQIESRLRVVRGTMSELIGIAGLPIDRLSRSIGFYRSALQQVEALDPEIRRILEAFAKGVTAGATQGVRRPAHEFALLRNRPTPYTPADVLGLLKLLSFLLASNWDAELARLSVVQADGIEALTAVDPLIHSSETPTAGDDASTRDAVTLLGQDLQHFLALTGVGGASNNWALGKSRTRSGRPIMANDPHLTPDLPPHWYLAHLSTPQWRVAGAALAGAPGIIVGHNGQVAWGVTAGLIDNTDLFLEEIGEDGASVRRGEEFLPCKAERETIKVRGGQSVTIQYLESDRGPILSSVRPGHRAIAIRATWLDPLPVVGFLGAQRVQTGEELRQLFRAWPSLPLNLVYADRDGSIGWQLVGRAPVRRKGHGLFPLNASDPEAGWEADPVPFDRMPHVADPVDGIVATANSAPHDGDGPYLGSDWLEGYRKRRIVEALASKSEWSAEENALLQLDVESLAWREIGPILLRIETANPDAALALRLLGEWDGNVTADSVGAAIFESFLVTMDRRVVGRKVTHALGPALGQGSLPLAAVTSFAGRMTGRVVHLLKEKPAGWFEHPWEREIELCLAEVVQTLRRDFGERPESWKWGRIRPLTLTHPAGRGVLGQVFNRGPYAIGGDTNTVAQAGVNPLDIYRGPLATASLRAVVEVGSWDEARFVLPGGQSGNPCSPHYDDMLALWLKGESITLAWSDEEIERAARTTLSLSP